MLSVRSYHHLRGRSCLATALRNVFEHAGCSMTEHEVLGLGSALLFQYTGDVERRRFMITIFSWPMDVSLAANLGVHLRHHFSNDPALGTARLIELLERGVPVPLKLHPSACGGLVASVRPPIVPHLPSHWVVAIAYDPVADRVTLHDNGRREPFQLSIAELETARHSGSAWQNPHGVWLELKFPDAFPPRAVSYWLALRQTVLTFRNTTSLLNQGIDGLAKFTRHAKLWPRLLTPAEISDTALRAITVITGGGGVKGGYRLQYARFVEDAAAVLGAPRLDDVARRFRESARQWQRLVEQLWHLVERPDDAAPFTRGSAFHATLDGLLVAESAAIDALATSMPRVPRCPMTDSREVA